MIRGGSQPILLPVTFSVRVLDWARRTAEISFPGEPACFLHVLTPLPPARSGAVWGTLTDEIRQRTAAARLHGELTGRGLPDPNVLVEVGVPAATICDVARRLPSELIALPTRPRPALERLLVGSVARDVVRQAPCPVLVSGLPELPPHVGPAGRTAVGVSQRSVLSERKPSAGRNSAQGSRPSSSGQTTPVFAGER